MFDNLKFHLKSSLISKVENAFASDCTDGFDSLSILEEMACWSSGNPDEEQGIDYAFSGDSSSELVIAYEEIVEALIGVQINYVVNGETVIGSFQEGNGVTLPWPDGFECDEDSETEIPFRISFEGDGTVTLSDVSLQYCKP